MSPSKGLFSRFWYLPDLSAVSWDLAGHTLSGTRRVLRVASSLIVFGYSIICRLLVSTLITKNGPGFHLVKTIQGLRSGCALRARKKDEEVDTFKHQESTSNSSPIEIDKVILVPKVLSFVTANICLLEINKQEGGESRAGPRLSTQANRLDRRTWTFKPRPKIPAKFQYRPVSFRLSDTALRHVKYQAEVPTLAIGN